MLEAKDPSDGGGTHDGEPEASGTRDTETTREIGEDAGRAASGFCRVWPGDDFRCCWPGCSWSPCSKGDPSKIPSALIGKPAPVVDAAAGARPDPRRRSRARVCYGRHRQGQAGGRQFLGIVVPAVRRGASAACHLAKARRCWRSTASTTRTSRRTPRGSWPGTAIPTLPSAPTRTAAPLSSGASTACPRRSSSMARAGHRLQARRPHRRRGPAYAGPAGPEEGGRRLVRGFG